MSRRAATSDRLEGDVHGSHPQADAHPQGRHQGHPLPGRYYLPDGTETSRTFSRQRTAEAFLARVELAEAQGEPIDPHSPTHKTITLGEWLERWLDRLKARVTAGTLAPRTAVAYESIVRNHLEPEFGDTPIDKITVGDVSAFLTALQAQGLTASTAVHVRACLSKVLTDAMRDELVERNVAQIAEPPKPRRKRPSAFTEEELRKIVLACVEDRLGMLFLFAMFTGLRSSELRGLRWQDVDLDGATYQIDAGLHRIPAVSARVVPQTGLVRSDPKTSGSGDQTPMSGASVQVLARQRDLQHAEREQAEVWHDSGYVFTSKIGTPLEPSLIRRHWRQLLERIGIEYRPDPERPGRGLHELRRTFATRLREAGVPIEDVQGLGRWSSPQVLLESYSAVSDDRLRAAAEIAAGDLGDLLAG